MRITFKRVIMEFMLFVSVSDNLSIFDDQHVILIGGDRPKQMLTEEASLIDTWGTDFIGESATI